MGSKVNETKANVVILNHTGKQCGVYQYGLSIYEALIKSQRHSVNYVEVVSAADLAIAITTYKPNIVIYNNHPLTMPWLNTNVISKYKGKLIQVSVVHEVNKSKVDRLNKGMFDYYICPDPTLQTNNPVVIKIPRIIPTYHGNPPLPSTLRVGSFGFGMGNKGFDKLVTRVQKEYNSAHISLLMPFNDVCDVGGKRFALATANKCRALMYKPGVSLEIRHDFFPKTQLLDFLASNTINAFLYKPLNRRGISSTIEHALAVRRPLAITRSGMFRHIASAWPHICVENNSLRSIINKGVKPLVPFYKTWTEERFLKRLEKVFDNMLDNK